jgi:glucokinase
MIGGRSRFTTCELNMARRQPLERSQRLLADIGGTNVRFALQSPGRRPHSFASSRGEDYRSLSSAIKDYLRQFDPRPKLDAAAFAVAGPTGDDLVEFTNSPWTLIRSSFELKRVEVINDFAAAALAIPHLSSADWRKIGRGKRKPEAPVAVVGPGTGLGVSCLIPTATGFKALETEGGHVTVAPVNDYEAGVLGFLRPKFGHVSAERVLSGPGLVNLYRALAPLEGQPVLRLAPATITRRAASGECVVCKDVVDMFSEMLGTVASNLALSVGARGGVYIAGGIVPKMGDTFNAQKFRHRFEDKGRLSDYLKKIPTYVVTHTLPAFLGLAYLLDRELGR